VAPYGIYDIAANAGWINLGITYDTAAFAVESIRRWWHGCGSARYPNATKLLITADCGGSNGARVCLWKRELQVLADDTRDCHQRLPSTARHQQVEPHRAPPARLHYPELTGQAAGQPSGHRAADRQHQDQGPSDRRLPP
jgi:hypothetical protein